MKRQEAFDRMRRNRDTAERRAVTRRIDAVIEQTEANAKRWVESFARASGYDATLDPLNLKGHLARARAFYPGETNYPGKKEHS